MNKRLFRRVAITLIGLLVFAQASAAALVAECPMDRGMLSLTIGAGEENPCGECGTSASPFGSLYANRCVSHCTADLQLTGDSIVLVPPATYSPVFVLEPPARDFRLAALYAPPPLDVSRRVLLHSYLI